MKVHTQYCDIHQYRIVLPIWVIVCEYMMMLTCDVDSQDDNFTHRGNDSKLLGWWLILQLYRCKQSLKCFPVYFGQSFSFKNHGWWFQATRWFTPAVHAWWFIRLHTLGIGHGRKEENAKCLYDNVQLRAVLFIIHVHILQQVMIKGTDDQTLQLLLTHVHALAILFRALAAWACSSVPHSNQRIHHSF